MLVDIQKDMLDPPDPVPAHVEMRNALEFLVASARRAGALVVHVQNDGSPGDPDEPHTPGWELALPTLSGELVIRKNKSDAFATVGLEDWLKSKYVERVVVAGMQSNYCIAATCRGALERGLDVVLASGAHATYDQGVSAAAISSRIEEELAKEGVKVVPFTNIEF